MVRSKPGLVMIPGKLGVDIFDSCPPGNDLYRVVRYESGTFYNDIGPDQGGKTRWAKIGTYEPEWCNLCGRRITKGEWNTIMKGIRNL